MAPQQAIERTTMSHKFPNTIVAASAKYPHHKDTMNNESETNKQKNTRDNNNAIQLGYYPTPKNSWTHNHDKSPYPPLSILRAPNNLLDNECWNCGKYHPNEKNKTTWISCPLQWQPKCLLQHARYVKSAATSKVTTDWVTGTTVP